MADLLDDDLVLVQRGGASYKMLGADLKAAAGPKPINPAPGDVVADPAFEGGTGTQGDPYILTASISPAPGSTVQSAQRITITSGSAGDSVLWTDNSVGAGNRFEQPVGVVGTAGTWVGRLNYLDTPDSTVDTTYVGDLQIGTVYFRWNVQQQTSAPPVVGAVTLSDVAGGNRFTSTAFPLSVTMTDDGIPTSTKALKAYAEGSFTVTPETDLITNVVDTQKTLPNFSTGLRGYDGLGSYGGGIDIFAPAQPTTGFIRPGVSRGTESAGMSFTHLPGGGVMCYHSLRLYAKVTTNPVADDDFIAFNISTTKYTQDGTNPPNPRTSLSDPGLIVGSKAPLCGAWSSTDNYEWVDFPIPPGGVLLTNLVVVGYRGALVAGITDDMGLTAIEVDGLRLTNNYAYTETEITVASSKDLDLFETYDATTQSDNNATGVLAMADPVNQKLYYNTYLTPPQTGTWTVGQSIVGPTKVGGATRLYCVLNGAGAVSDLTTADPGYAPWVPSGAGPYTGNITFPAVLPSGNAPDVELPAGSTLQVSVEATNASAASTGDSNIITPS